ncbi:hypothetical protein ABH908_000235 [Pseudomonas frederiksbergensis]
MLGRQAGAWLAECLNRLIQLRTLALRNHREARERPGGIQSPNEVFYNEENYGLGAVIETLRCLCY